MRKSICHNAEYVRQRSSCSSACKCVVWVLRESFGSFGSVGYCNWHRQWKWQCQCRRLCCNCNAGALSQWHFISVGLCGKDSMLCQNICTLYISTYTHGLRFRIRICPTASASASIYICIFICGHCLKSHGWGSSQLGCDSPLDYLKPTQCIRLMELLRRRRAARSVFER